MSERNYLLIKKYIKEHPKYEVCGKTATVIHHKIPVVMGGIDDFSNYIALCDKCHDYIHANGHTRSTLTKIGIQKRKEKICNGTLKSTLFISVVDLLNAINDEECRDIKDVLDVINDLCNQPNSCKAVKNIFHDSYEYTRQYREFRKEMENK